MERTCRKELVKRIAESRGMTQKDVAGVVSDLFEHIKAEVSGGRKVAIANFGVFRMHETPAREDYFCPATGMRQSVPARRSLRFKQSADVRKTLNTED